MSRILFSVILVTIGLMGAAAAAPIDRADAYRAAVPLYQYDKSQPLDVTVAGLKRYPECVMLRLSYTSANGERVPAVLFEPFRASLWHPVPGIVMLHGLGGSKEDLVPFGHFLAATGYATLLIDEYGHGERRAEDKPASGAGSTPAQQEGAALAGFEQTVIDVRRAIDYMQTRPHINPHRIGLLGFSLGAIISADVAGVDKRVKAVVLVSGGGDVVDILKHLAENDTLARSRMDGARWNLASVLLTSVDPLTFANHTAPIPILMQNGTSDNIVTPDKAKDLYQALSSSPESHAEIDWCQGCGHFLPLDQIYPHMRIWLAKNLKGEVTYEAEDQAPSL